MSVLRPAILAAVLSLGLLTAGCHHRAHGGLAVLHLASAVAEVALVAAIISHHDAHYHDHYCGHRYRYYEGRYNYWYGGQWEYYDDDGGVWYGY